MSSSPSPSPTLPLPQPDLTPFLSVCGSSFTVHFSSLSPYLLIVTLRTNRLNTLTKAFWTDCAALFRYIGTRYDVVRCVIFASHGEYFTAGLDLGEHTDLFSPHSDSEMDSSRRSLRLRSMILSYQDAISAIENIYQPVLMAISGPCIGGGMDIILAGDCRYCVKTPSQSPSSSSSPSPPPSKKSPPSTYFSIAEVNIGLAADVGTLQRIEKCVGSSSVVREWVYTGRVISSEEMIQHGVVSKGFSCREDMMKYVETIGGVISTNSPVAVIGSKSMLNYSRDHSVSEGLTMMSIWNSVHLQTEDIGRAAMAMRGKEKPIFSKL